MEFKSTAVLQPEVSLASANCSCGDHGGPTLTNLLSKPKVNEADVPRVVDHDVFGLEVAVDDLKERV